MTKDWKNQGLWLVVMVSVMLVSVGCASTGRTVHQKAVQTTVAQFANSAAKHDVARMAEVLHKDSRQYAWFKGKLMKLPKGAYLGLLQSKKIGGPGRTLRIHSVDVLGNLASVKVSLVGKKASLDYYMSLMKVEGRWQIMSNVMRVTPRAS